MRSCDAPPRVSSPQGEITRALGLVYNAKLDRTVSGPRAAWQMFNTGLRCKRFALVVSDGVVSHVAVDEDENGVRSAPQPPHQNRRHTPQPTAKS